MTKNTGKTVHSTVHSVHRTGQKRSSKMPAFAAHTSYQKRFNKVLSFVVMGASEDFLHLTTVVYEIMSVCMYVKQQTDDLYIIICNCIYIVVINCGWNNNVAVKIVAC